VTDRSVIAEARAAFRRRYGTDPVGVWSAPGRVNLIGEHNLGLVLPFAIDRRAVVALGPGTTGRRARVCSVSFPDAVELAMDQLNPASLSGWSAYPLGVAWALARTAEARDLPGFDLAIHSQVPIGSGLSSSAAIECATAVALNAFWDLGLDRPALAQVGQIAENTVVGAPTGIMDQTASLLGRRDAAVHLDCRSMAAETVHLGLADHDLSIVVVDTRTRHDHRSGGYGLRRRSCETAARVMGVPSLRSLGPEHLEDMAIRLDAQTFRRARHVVTENQRVAETVRLLGVSGPGVIGPQLDGSHASMRDDFEISTRELDLAVTVARDSGAIGARLTGGGFGGSALALVPTVLGSAIRRPSSGHLPLGAGRRRMSSSCGRRTEHRWLRCRTRAVGCRRGRSLWQHGRDVATQADGAGGLGGGARRSTTGPG
jgi:galactokinase